ncbi:MAG TPA: thioesterase family protein, partial [Glaciecola sp.]|nr:thioesterase family protein [Glaciecola sp.]
MTFDDVLEQTSAYLAGEKDSITISNNWSQGRTVYGGISSAVLFACVADKITDERPIKTINVNF